MTARTTTISDYDDENDDSGAALVMMSMKATMITAKKCK